MVVSRHVALLKVQNRSATKPLLQDLDRICFCTGFRLPFSVFFCLSLLPEHLRLEEPQWEVGQTCDDKGEFPRDIASICSNQLIIHAILEADCYQVMTIEDLWTWSKKRHI